MAGVSTESLKKVEQVLAGHLAINPEHLAQELFAVVDVLDANGGLRRGLTDPSRSAENREGLTVAVFTGKISESALTVLKVATSLRWSQERDLADALETAAVEAAAFAAETREGVQGLETVINELLTFINSVNDSAEAQVALTDQRASAQAKKKLALAMGGNPATSEGTLLIERVATAPRGASPARLAEKFVENIVDRQNRSIARVSTARPLTESQIEKLRAGLSRAYGKELKLDISVDSSLIGGLRVQVGDEIMDGTVQSRLAQLDRTIAQR